MARTSTTKALLLALALVGCGQAVVAASDAGDSATLPAPQHLVGGGGPVWPFTVNGTSVGNSPNLTFPGCDAGTPYGVVDGGGLGCVSGGNPTTTLTGDTTGTGSGTIATTTTQLQSGADVADTNGTLYGFVNNTNGTGFLLGNSATSTAWTALAMGTGNFTTGPTAAALPNAYALAYDGSNIHLNSPTDHLYFGIGGSARAILHTTNFQLGQTEDFSSGLVTLSINNTLGAPSGNPFNGALFYASGGKMYLLNGTGSAIDLSGAGSASITSLTGDGTASGPGAATLTIGHAQGGKYTFNAGGDQINLNSTTSAATATILGDGTTYAYLNAPSGGATGLLLNDSTFAQYSTAANTYWGSSSAAGAAEYLDVGAAAAVHYGVSATSATLQYDAQTSDTATHHLKIKGQDAFASATTNVNGGDVYFEAGSSATSAGNPGAFVFNETAAGGGAGAFYGGFLYEYNAAPFVRFGQYSGAYGAIWFTDGGTPGPTNWSFLGNSGSSYFNAPSSVGSFYFGFGGSYTTNATSNGWQFFDGPSTDLGGGSGVLGISNAATLPTTLPTTGIVLANSAVITNGSPGLHGYQYGSVFSDQSIFPVIQGTHDVQAGKIYEFAGWTNVSGASTHSIVTVPCATSGTVCSVEYNCSARDTVGGTVGDGETVNNILVFKNVSGTVTQGANAMQARVACDTSFGCVPSTGASSFISIVISGTNIQITGSGNSGSGATYDWTCYAKEIVN